MRYMTSPILLIEKLRQNTFLQIFTIYLRYLIGGAFVIAAIGMGKLSGKSFIDPAPIETLVPMQQFFRVMADSGLYWKFIGWFQVACGALLMTQRFAKLGALLFFGMIVNIFLITISYDFRGTPIVTGLMTLAATYLLAWDFNSFRYLVIKPSVATTHEEKPLSIHDRAYWAILGSIIFSSIIAIAIIKFNVVIALLISFAIGLLGFFGYFLPVVRRWKISTR
jgi:hypothetical protein